MRQIYAFESKEDHKKYHPIIERHSQKLQDYQLISKEKFALISLPKGIGWTTESLATSVLSDVPIPAFTNKDLIYISPDLSA
ncbi:hypothetical protein KP78_00210 [Jeotgalibacillus soli]|uniref:Uncharacterized protein n=2 Tax=Jeotgalibacillus soli TaxID=889306 RepID=A0A0C2W7C2_9BACL|nr:hypothetical protein KP78_00210 [Jeotgalibacillus soli]